MNFFGGEHGKNAAGPDCRGQIFRTRSLLKKRRPGLEALDKDKYDIRRYDPLPTSAGWSNASQLQVALIIMHGRGGEDGAMQGFLDLLEIPYQGSGVLASALAMNKELSKVLYQMTGLRVPNAMAFSREIAPSPQEIQATLGLPVVIKPATEGSSIGISLGRNPAELKTVWPRLSATTPRCWWRNSSRAPKSPAPSWGTHRPGPPSGGDHPVGSLYTF